MLDEVLKKHEATLKKTRYINAVYAYGFLVVLYLLDQYERKENYEECGIILSALNEINETLGGKLPTKYGEKAFAVFYDNSDNPTITLKDPEAYIKAIPHYAEQVKYDVNKTLK